MKTSFIDAIVRIENENKDNVEIFKDFDRVKLDKKDILQLGTARKRFVRTSGKVLLDMYDDIKAGNIPNAVTCVDDAIRYGILSREEFANTYISSIVKKARNGHLVYKQSELIGSRICEVLGVKSSFIASSGDQNSDQYICVDFLKNNQKLVDFGEFTGAKFIDGTTLTAKAWMDYLEKGMAENLPKQSKLREKLRTQIIVDFIRWFLVNSAVIKNDDLARFNVALVHSARKKDYSLAPAFDFEYTMGEKKGRIEFFLFESEQRLDESISYLVKNYPNELAIAMSDINILNSSTKMHKIDEIIEQFTSNDEALYDVSKSDYLANEKIFTNRCCKSDALKAFFRDNLKNLVNIYERRKSEANLARDFERDYE